MVSWRDLKRLGIWPKKFPQLINKSEALEKAVRTSTIRVHRARSVKSFVKPMNKKVFENGPRSPMSKLQMNVIKQ